MLSKENFKNCELLIKWDNQINVEKHLQYFMYCLNVGEKENMILSNQTLLNLQIQLIELIKKYIQTNQYIQIEKQYLDSLCERTDRYQFNKYSNDDIVDVEFEEQYAHDSSQFCLLEHFLCADNM